MGTETLADTFVPMFTLLTPVKLNNPQMGTET